MLVARWLAEKRAKAQDPAHQARHQLVIVYGDSGTGKTSFLCRCLDSDFCRKERALAFISTAESCSTSLHSKRRSPSTLGCGPGLAGQVFGAIKEDETARDHALGIVGHDDEDSFCTWVRPLRQNCSSDWLIPVLSARVVPLTPGRQRHHLDRLVG